MKVNLQRQQVETSQLLRWGAEITGAILFFGWLAFMGGELVKTRFEMPAKEAFYQAASLVLVFTGCAFLWRHALVGSALVFLGTALFFAINQIAAGVLPGWNALWFAIPGVLALLAWLLDRQRRGTGQQ
ncbi:DUF7670 domain-containing protein [Bythopirellula goksoeyrii]|uniref:DUF7670 domain-containing protein n=1 Tax=Bythopirellula goksoeyrii TaxID=1400387 RepID=A0A5B9Q6K3_9BACT|nr:hypothetical protein [Bythopirellula goksoeyrii]QEG33330.1 hypothetical protein Pr1d_05910 [Bythopirellula goksoeyrii]